jgi:hypothetical protein
MSRANMNAKEEFLSAISTRPVKCAEISYGASSLWTMNDEDEPTSKKIFLKVGYNETAWEEFLEQLDFDYDAGYGGQELFGTVWFSASDEWMTRGEYDGSEWWEVHSKPQIPNHLI